MVFGPGSGIWCGVWTGIRAGFRNLVRRLGWYSVRIPGFGVAFGLIFGGSGLLSMEDFTPDQFRGVSFLAMLFIEI